MICKQHQSSLNTLWRVEEGKLSTYIYLHVIYIIRVFKGSLQIVDHEPSVQLTDVRNWLKTEISLNNICRKALQYVSHAYTYLKANCPSPSACHNPFCFVPLHPPPSKLSHKAHAAMQAHLAPPTTQVVMGVAWALLTAPCSCGIMGSSLWCQLCLPGVICVVVVGVLLGVGCTVILLIETLLVF